MPLFSLPYATPRFFAARCYADTADYYYADAMPFILPPPFSPLPLRFDTPLRRQPPPISPLLRRRYAIIFSPPI